MKVRRHVARVWQELPRQGVLVVRHPRVPSGEPWPQVDILIWEKLSDRRMRLRDGLVSIEMTSGNWWVHGELLHYATSWPDVERWATSHAEHIWQGQRVQMFPASHGEP
jgi:hypothetical protein